MSHGHRRPPSEEGFSLAELLIAVSLLSFVALGFGAMYGTAQTYLTSSISGSHAQGNAAFALEQVSRNLRRATGVSAANDTEIVITYKAVVGGPDLMMRYVLSGADLQWYPSWQGSGNPGPMTVLADGLAPNGFQVTNPDGSAVTPTSSAVKVRVATAVVNQPDVELVSTAQLRGRQP